MKWLLRPDKIGQTRAHHIIFSALSTGPLRIGKRNFLLTYNLDEQKLFAPNLDVLLV